MIWATPFVDDTLLSTRLLYFFSLPPFFITHRRAQVPLFASTWTSDCPPFFFFLSSLFLALVFLLSRFSYRFGCHWRDRRRLTWAVIGTSHTHSHTLTHLCSLPHALLYISIYTQVPIGPPKKAARSCCCYYYYYYLSSPARVPHDDRQCLLGLHDPFFFLPNAAAAWGGNFIGIYSDRLLVLWKRLAVQSLFSWPACLCRPLLAWDLRLKLLFLFSSVLFLLACLVSFGLLHRRRRWIHSLARFPLTDHLYNPPS